MESIAQYLSSDHERCDRLFADAEQAVSDGDWSGAGGFHGAFVDAMEQHFAMEEQVLFPSLEGASGAPAGPTRVMRHEHEQMRALFRQLDGALGAHDGATYLGLSETLLILMQQHNAKEEQILYPMGDRMLDASGIIGQMQSLGGA